jgi:hypothetical protein
MIFDQDPVDRELTRATGVSRPAAHCQIDRLYRAGPFRKRGFGERYRQPPEADRSNQRYCRLALLAQLTPPFVHSRCDESQKLNVAGSTPVSGSIFFSNVRMSEEGLESRFRR